MSPLPRRPQRIVQEAMAQVATIAGQELLRVLDQKGLHCELVILMRISGDEEGRPMVLSLCDNPGESTTRKMLEAAYAYVLSQRPDVDSDHG